MSDTIPTTSTGVHDEFVHYSRPSIDVLFETAAEDYKEDLVGIVLSGVNSDGAQVQTANLEQITSCLWELGEPL